MAKTGRGGRGASSFTATLKKQLQKMNQRGQFPTSIYHGGDQTRHGSILKTINDVFDYSSAQKQYMDGKMKNGLPNVTIRETSPSQLYITTSHGTMRTSYPQGKSQAETDQIKQGAIKHALINHMRSKGIV